MDFLPQDIWTDLQNDGAIGLQTAARIPGGWLNRLWRAQTDAGPRLIKQYSPERFDEKKLRDIESALQRQRVLWENGFPCPKIFPAHGRALRVSPLLTTYLVTEFCPGKNETAETITPAQMADLGRVCAQMHQAFAALPCQGVKGFPLRVQSVRDALWENYRQRRQALSPEDPAPYRQSVLDQEALLRWADGGFWARMPLGIAHEDFTPDNLLFTPQGVSAVIDFDRNQYSFLWHDIGRAIVSFALEKDGLNARKARAFVRGYAGIAPLTPADAADALRLCCLLELTWWIQPSMFLHDAGKATRYLNETLWLMAHFFKLDALLDGE